MLAAPPKLGLNGPKMALPAPPTAPQKGCPFRASRGVQGQPPCKISSSWHEQIRRYKQKRWWRRQKWCLNGPKMAPPAPPTAPQKGPPFNASSGVQGQPPCKISLSWLKQFRRYKQKRLISYLQKTDGMSNLLKRKKKVSKKVQRGWTVTRQSIPEHFLTHFPLFLPPWTPKMPEPRFEKFSSKPFTRPIISFAYCSNIKTINIDNAKQKIFNQNFSCSLF